MGQGFALQASQHQKAMNQSFGVVHGNLSSGQPAGKENGGGGQRTVFELTFIIKSVYLGLDRRPLPVGPEGRGLPP